jgi:hypothetical protein
MRLERVTVLAFQLLALIQTLYKRGQGERFVGGKGGADGATSGKGALASRGAG